MGPQFSLFSPCLNIVVIHPTPGFLLAFLMSDGKRVACVIYISQILPQVASCPVDCTYRCRTDRVSIISVDWYHRYRCIVLDLRPEENFTDTRVTRTRNFLYSMPRQRLVCFQNSFAYLDYLMFHVTVDDNSILRRY